MRIWRLPLLVWMVVWTVFVIAGHTRGVIPLASPACSICQHDDKPVPLFFGQLPDCCAKKHSESGSHGEHPFKKSADNCAICHIATTMSCEIIVAPLHLGMGFLEILPRERTRPAATVELLLAYDSRGPPTYMSLRIVGL